jgi:HAD superfamily hydrolase (TIGR01490 family)
VLQITKGWDHQEVKRLVAETINDVIEPLIYEEALDLIDYHLAQGDEVWLVSMSPAEIVEPFAELLGITGAISSRAKLDEQGKFTGEMEFFAQGENKAVAIRALAHESVTSTSTESFAYSDSETDIPMLETVGHAYAVNADRQLAKVAHDSQWPLLSFTHPVRAHDRSKSHTPFLLSALVIGVAAVLGRTKYPKR